MTSAPFVHRPTILLTDPIHADAHARLAEQANVLMLPSGLEHEDSNEALRRFLVDAEGLIVRRQLPENLFDATEKLRGVVRHGVGLDFIPVERATARRIPVANTPGVNATAVAEYVIAAMLAVSRQLAHFDGEVRRGNWLSRATAGAKTFDLFGRTLGIIGYGAIGKRLGEIASRGFAMRVVAHTTTPSRLPSDVNGLSLTELFAASDFVVVACPLTSRTRGMVDRSVITSAKSGAVLINVGRGPVVHEEDLADALTAGILGGAVLDVFEVQPLPVTSRLRNHPKVILTPHLAGVTNDSERAMGLLAVDTMLKLIRGERHVNVVNKEVYR